MYLQNRTGSVLVNVNLLDICCEQCCTIDAINYCVHAWSYSDHRLSAGVLYCTFSSVNHQVSETSLKNIFSLVIGLMLNQVQSPQTLTAKPEGEIHEVWVPSCLWMFAQPTFEAIPNPLASNFKSVWLRHPEESAEGRSAAHRPQPPPAPGQSRGHGLVRPSRHCPVPTGSGGAAAAKEPLWGTRRIARAWGVIAENFAKYLHLE